MSETLSLIILIALEIKQFKKIKTFQTGKYSVFFKHNFLS